MRLLIPLLFASYLVAAPPDDLRRAEVRSWGSAQGLPEENIYSISETPDGFLWLASHDGLIRFDGLNFRVFSPGEASGFRDKSLNGAITVQGNLWLGGRDYVGYTLPDEFRSFTNPHFRAVAVPRNMQDRYGVASMQALPDGTIYIRRADGIYKMRTRSDGAPPEQPTLYLSAPNGTTLTGFFHGASGKDWAASPDGIFLWKDGRWTAAGGPPVQSATLLEARDGKLWAFGGNGLFTFDGSGQHVVFQPPKIALDPIRALFEDAAGDIWVGLIGSIARVRRGHVEILPLEHTMHPGDFVKVIHQTRDGALWASTNWGRLIRVDSPVFQTLAAENGLGEASIAAVTRDAGGRLWVGTRAKGLYTATASGFRPVPDTAQGILHAIAAIGPDQLLYANVEGLWLRTASGSTLLAPAPSQTMNHYRAFSPNYGTHIFYNDSQVIYRIPLPLSTPLRMERVAPLSLVRTIVEAADGLWAVSWERGLCHVPAGAGAATCAPLDARRELRAFTMFELSPEYIVVGSSGGAMIFDRRTRQFLNRPPLFEQDQSFIILSDRQSHIWFAGRRALLAASRDSLLRYAQGELASVLPLRITAQQGLTSANFGLGTSSGAHFDSGGRIWLASVGGLTNFRPSDVIRPNEQIPTAISHLRADGADLPVSGALQIPAGVRRLEIHYTVLNRKADRNPIFRYRLDGDSPAWMETSIDQADFTNLSPGTYRFEVQARLASQQWSEPAFLQFRIPPYWYQRRSLQFAAGALLFFLLVVSVRWRGRQIIARNAELEERVRVRTEELAHARDDAESAARAKSDFLAAMSHEIRTPMNGVIGMVEVLKQTPLNAEQRHMLAVVAQSGESLIDILNDILDFSKIEAGALTLESVPFNLHDLTRQCHDLFANQAAARGLAFEVTLAPGVPVWVSGDANRLRQVLLNLLSNALKFTPAGRVRLDVQPGAAGKISFLVSDSGIGIPQDKLDSVFGAFTQAETSITRRFGGTGLGLAISLRLATAMQGSLAVKSELNQGSVFTLSVMLPAAPTPATAAEEPATNPLAHILHRILIVEDNAVNRQVAYRLLSNLGCSVTVTNDGIEGVAAASRESFDLILMDCHMPGLDGYEATRQIRALPGPKGQVRIVALTAGVFDEDRQRSIDAGMNDFLSKPIRTDDLRRVLAVIQPTPQPSSRAIQ